MFKNLALSLLLAAGLARAAVPSVSLPLDWTTANGISRANLNLNPIALRDGLNVAIDSLNPVLAAFTGWNASLAIASNQDLILKVDADANGIHKLAVTANNVDSILRIHEDGTARIFDHLVVDSNLTVRKVTAVDSLIGTVVKGTKGAFSDSVVGAHLKTVSGNLIVGGTANITGLLTSANISAIRSAAGAGAVISVTQSDNTDNNSNAILQAGVGGSSGGDPFSKYVVSGGATWSTGIDNSVTGDPYRICSESNPGSGICTDVTTAGAWTFPGSITQNTGTTAFTVDDNTTEAWQVQQGTIDYILVRTTNSSEAVAIGNTTTNPAINFLGSGTKAFSGPVTAASTVVVTGTVTADSLISRKFYGDTSFTVTGTGFATPPTGTAYASWIGRTVVMHIPALSGTSNASTFTITGIPTKLRPARLQVVFGGDVNEGGVTSYQGSLDVGTDGVLTVYRRTAVDANGAGGYATSGSKGMTAVTITYSLL